MVTMLRWRYLKTSFSWWFGVIWALVGTSFAIGGVCGYASAKAFEERSAGADASVVEKGQEELSNGDRRYWLRYRWQDPGGVERDGLAGVRWDAWQLHREGDPLPIRYLPEEPERSSYADPEGVEWWVLPLIFGAVGLVFGGVGWFLALGSWFDSGRIVQLLLEGSVAVGRVSAIEENLNVRINRRHPRLVVYEFKDTSGKSRTARGPNLPRHLEDRWKPGDPITVVYDPADPERSVLDLFDERSDDARMAAREAS